MHGRIHTGPVPWAGTGPLTERRIAVVGGGISGLTAALTLADRGARRVTLYEAEPRLGGKIKSCYQDELRFELGAVIVPRTFGHVARLARRVGFTGLQPYRARGVLETTGAGDSPARRDLYAPAADHGFWQRLVSFRQLWHRIMVSGIRQPGYRALDPDLFLLSTREYAMRRGFAQILEPFGAFLCGMGYGSVDEIPAAYHLKIMAGAIANQFLKKSTLGLAGGHLHAPGGLEGLCQAIGRYLAGRGVELRSGSPVDAIERRQGTGHSGAILVESRGEREIHDQLVVATPPLQLLGFLDLTAEERELFSDVTHLTYHAVAFEARGIARDEYVLRGSLQGTAATGHLVLHHGPGPGARVFVGYQYSRCGAPAVSLDHQLERDITARGGAVTRILRRQEWEYFPHFPLGRLDPERHRRLESLQGRRSTYHVGSLFAGESTELCVRHACQIASRM